jgi:hypothetical protein
MDEGDYGQDYQARLNADAIERHRRRRAEDGRRCSEDGRQIDFQHTAAEKKSVPSELVPGSGECLWCEEEIPEARRLAVPGCELCVICQDIKERFPERQG